MTIGSTRAFFLSFCLVFCAGNTAADQPMDFMALRDFAKSYAAAWSSQDPELLASFYSPEGALIVNDGEPAVGRAAITEKARSFMEAFPDMVVEMQALQGNGEKAEFHWLWTGTNTGPGGTGRPVRITGYEDWIFGPDNLIQESKGHYDESLYEAQVNGAGG
jgi:uncharacterized protein (TIGR02246 family)